MAVWTPEIAAAMRGWKAFPSSDLLQSDGLEVFARHNKDMAWHSDSLPVLLSHLPADPRALATGSSATISIRELVNRHRGEVRELSGTGYWIPWEGKEPAIAHHPQLRGLIIRQQAPASGGSTGLYMREAKVFSLMDLFHAHGHAFTARELYDVYLSCPFLARRRLRQRKRVGCCLR